MTNLNPGFDAVLTGKSYLLASDLVTFAVTGAETDGAYSLVETITQPKVGVPMLHVHPQQESLYIIEGEFRITTMPSGVWRTVHIGPGGVAHIAAGVPHTFENMGKTPGKLLAVLSPAGIEHFFAELGVPVTDWDTLPNFSRPPDPDQVAAIMVKHRMTLITPPPDVREEE
jgi:mannose-6-phosphate isomerase-like protein (cupin superfamily)